MNNLKEQVCEQVYKHVNKQVNLGFQHYIYEQVHNTVWVRVRGQVRELIAGQILLNGKC